MDQEIAYDFEWDPVKALSNARKHDVTFDQATTVFLDKLALTVYDESSSQDEERWFTLGFDSFGRGAHLSVRRPEQRSGAHHLGAQGDQARAPFL